MNKVETAWTSRGLSLLDKARFNKMGIRRAREAERFTEVLDVAALEEWCKLKGRVLGSITPTEMNDTLERERQAHEAQEFAQLSLPTPELAQANARAHRAEEALGKLKQAYAALDRELGKMRSLAHELEHATRRVMAHKREVQTAMRPAHMSGESI